MEDGQSIFIGTGGGGRQRLVPARDNPHGPIAGASATGEIERTTLKARGDAARNAVAAGEQARLEPGRERRADPPLLEAMARPPGRFRGR